jgi:hypothetical protein
LIRSFTVLAGFLVGIGLIYTKTQRPGNPGVGVTTESVQEAATRGPQAEAMASNSISSTPTPTPVAIVPSIPVSEDLNRVMLEIKPKLATYDGVKGLKEDEVHGTPQAVLDAGAALGDLEEYLEKRPDEFKSATPFYTECALNRSLLPSVRAVCLHALRKKPTEWAPGVSEQIQNVPLDVSDLERDL